MPTSARDEPPIPSVIPKVDFVDGEPVIATTQVVKPSPVPRALAIILVIMGALSLVAVALGQVARTEAANNNRDLIERQQVQIDNLEALVARVEADEVALRALIASLLAVGDDPEAQRQILEDFINAGGTIPAPLAPTPVPGPDPAAAEPSSSAPSRPTGPREPGRSGSDQPAPGPAPEPEPQPPPEEEPEPNPVLPPEVTEPLEPITEPLCAVTTICIGDT